MASKPSLKFKMSKFQRKLNRTRSSIDEDSDEGETKRYTAPSLLSRFRRSSIPRVENSTDFVVETKIPATNLAFDYDSIEEPNVALTTQICSNTIRQNILFHTRRFYNVSTKILEDIENSKFPLKELTQIFSNMKNYELNSTNLWCVFIKRGDLVRLLVNHGADPNYCDENGYTPLHMSAFCGCQGITKFLLSIGANPQVYTKALSPLHYAAFGNSTETAKMLINNGAIVNETKLTVDETLLQSAVRCRALKCLELFLDEGADVNQCGSRGSNAIHLAADLGHDKCLEILLKNPRADPSIKITRKSRNTTALHLAAEEGSVKCVRLLLQHKTVDVNAKDFRGFTPLHMAAKTSSLDCVEALLSIGVGIDVNAVDNDMRTPLHAAIGKSESNLEVIDSLIKYRANINAKDKYGFSALHLAAVDGLSDCVEFLINRGANVTTKSKQGVTALNVISRKTPASLDFITFKLDQAITISHTQEHSYQEVEMKLDFRNIVAHCHPFETEYLKTFVDEGKKEILGHPLCQAFLYLKWKKARGFFLTRILAYAIKVFFLTLFVLSVTKCDPDNKASDNSTVPIAGNSMSDGQLDTLCNNLKDHIGLLSLNQSCLFWFLLVMLLIEIYMKVYSIVGFTFKSHFSETQNIFEWVEIFLFITFLAFYEVSSYLKVPIGAFVMLLGWYNLTFLFGQLPEFGAQFEMYNRIQKEFFKLLFTFVLVLIGFTCSFIVMFPNYELASNNFILWFISILVFMIGEQNLDLLNSDSNSYFIQLCCQILFVLFLFLITIVLMNLLIGIAVNDIQSLKKTAELSKLVRQTKLIYHIESLTMREWFPYWPDFISNWLRKILRKSILMSLSGYRVVLIVRPLNPGERRLPPEILTSAYDLAKSRNRLVPFSSTYFGTPNDTEYNENSSSDLDDNPESFRNIIKENSQKIESMQNEIQELKNMIKKLLEKN